MYVCMYVRMHVSLHEPVCIYAHMHVHCVCLTVPNGFRGVRLATSLAEVVIRGEVLKAEQQQDVSIRKIVSWLRAIWSRRQRWARNRDKAAHKRDAILALQRVVRGHLGRLEAKRHRIQQKRITLLVTREWRALLARRREVAAVRMCMRVCYDVI